VRRPTSSQPPRHRRLEFMPANADPLYILKPNAGQRPPPSEGQPRQNTGERRCWSIFDHPFDTLWTQWANLLDPAGQPSGRLPTQCAHTNWSTGWSIIRLSPLRRWAVSRGRKSLIHGAGILPCLPSETVEIIEHSGRSLSSLSPIGRHPVSHRPVRHELCIAVNPPEANSLRRRPCLCTCVRHGPHWHTVQR